MDNYLELKIPINESTKQIIAQFEDILAQNGVEIMRLTKEEFCTAVNKFEQMCKEEHDLLAALDIGPEWKPGLWISTYYDFLNDMCDFDPEHETIEYGNDLDYYCFELDFGHKWKPGMITIDDEDIPCRNAEELWDLIKRKSAE